MPSLDAVLEIARTLCAVGLIALACFGMGRPILRRLRLAEDDSWSLIVWSLALGLVIGGDLLLMLGWVGWLYEPAVAAITMAGCLSAVVEIACSWLGSGTEVSTVRITRGLGHWGDWMRPETALWAAIAAVLLLTLTLALAPPTDATVLARLEMPKDALVHHAVYSALHPAGGPLNLVQTWFLWALALDGPVAVNVLHWGLGVLTAAATVLLAREFLVMRWALVAAAIVLIAPGVQWQLALPLEDLALALYTTLALVAASQVLVQYRADAWPLAAGLALGAAVAISPAGLLFGGALAIVWMHTAIRRTDVRAQCLNAGRVVLWSALAIAGPWLLAAGVDAPGQQTQSWQSLVAHLGPLVLAASLGLLFARRLRGLNVVLCCAAAYLVLALIVRPATSWWAPALAPAAAATAWVVEESRRLPRWASIVALLLAVPVAVGPVAANCSALPGVLAVAIGTQRRGEFLAMNEPSYRAASLVNHLAGTGDSVLCHSTSTFYFSCPASHDRKLLPAELAGVTDGAPAQLVEWARRSGFTYLLLTEPLNSAASASESPAPQELSDALLAGEISESSAAGQVIPILEYRTADDNNRYTRYRLLRLH